MPDEDLILETLKKEYFRLAATESIPNTPKVTEKCDKLEAEIRKRIQNGGECVVGAA